MAGGENPIIEQCIDSQEELTESAATQLEKIESGIEKIGEKILSTKNVNKWLGDNNIELSEDIDESLLAVVMLLSENNFSDSFPSVVHILGTGHDGEGYEEAKAAQADLFNLITDDPIIDGYVKSYSILSKAKYSNEQIEGKAAQDLAQCLKDATYTEETTSEVLWKYASPERAKDFRITFADGRGYTDQEIENGAYIADWLKESGSLNLDSKWEQGTFLKLIKAIIDYQRKNGEHKQAITNDASAYDIFPGIDLHWTSNISNK